MKYKPKQYAEALVKALDGAEPETARVRIRVFAELLKKHHMLGKAENIVRAAERRLAKRAGARRIRVESAAPASAALQKDIADIFGGKAWIEQKVQPGLLAGVRVLIDDETLIDASGKRRIAQMFRREYLERRKTLRASFMSEA